MNKIFILCLIFYTWVFSLSAHAVSESYPCSSVSQLTSKGGSNEIIAINFTNQSSEKVSIFWLDFSGKEIFYKELKSQATYNQSSYTGHIWLIKNKNKECVSVYELKGISGDILFTGNNKDSDINADETILEKNSKVMPVSQKLKEKLALDPFYKKYINESGLLILSSGKVPDKALIRANEIIGIMLKNCQHVLKKLQSFNIKIAIMAVSEKTLDIPEHSDLQKVFPETNWNTRARGLGATLERPVTSCAEENLLCYSNDSYRGENILVHEFAHTILLGLQSADPDIYTVKKAYESALKKGLWKNTYAETNFDEYWAEGVQSWFNVNLESIPSNGIHNEINTREELKEYDPGLAKIIRKVFSDSNISNQCK